MKTINIQTITDEMLTFNLVRKFRDFPPGLIFLSQRKLLWSCVERINTGVGVCAYNLSHKGMGIREIAGQVFLINRWAAGSLGDSVSNNQLGNNRGRHSTLASQFHTHAHTCGHTPTHTFRMTETTWSFTTPHKIKITDR